MLQLLRWACSDDLNTCANASAALEAIMQMPGPHGLPLAADWLGEILLHLAQDAQAYHALHAVSMKNQWAWCRFA